MGMNSMRMGYLVAASISTVAAFPVNHTQAQTQGEASGFIGKWQLSMAQSRPAPGETLPTSIVTQIERMDTAHVRWSTTTINAQGQKDVETFDNPGNGEFYSLNGYTMVAHRLSTTAVQSIFRDDTGQTDVLTCTLARNGRQMTCLGVVTHSDTSKVQYTDVFDRQ